jgi:fatty acid desaturase
MYLIEGCSGGLNREVTDRGQEKRRRLIMLWTIILVLLVLWALGFFAFHAPGLIHLLLVVALVVFIVNLLTGRRTI